MYSRYNIVIGILDIPKLLIKTWAFLQFSAEKSFPLSDRPKMKVIDKLEVADSESDFGLHGKHSFRDI